MLARRLVCPASAASVPSVVRTFVSTSPCRIRSPGLGDITPDGADAFNAKQKEFRDGLEAQKRKKEQADSQLLVADTPSTSFAARTSTTRDTGSSSKATAVLGTLGLGSLSTNPDTGEARQAETDTSSKRTGRLSSLIYGTEEGRQMDKEMERSFSQVLARGKYVHSIVFHHVKPDKVEEYVDLTSNWYPRMANMEENKVNLVGSWRTEVGDTDTFGTASLCPRIDS